MPRTLLILAFAAICAGCGGDSTSSSSRSSQRTSTHSIVARDRAALAREGFSVDTTITQPLSEGSVLAIFHSICTGSADGHCQSVDVFRGGATQAVWHRQYIGVRLLRAVPNGFAVTATSYASQDPLCCPSLPDVRDVYTWNGSGFDERGPLPKTPGS
jgi:hypothetical protein